MSGGNGLGGIGAGSAPVLVAIGTAVAADKSRKREKEGDRETGEAPEAAKTVQTREAFPTGKALNVSA
jgi:hypothetical protein